MTTHTYNTSRPIGKTLRQGDESIVTVLDHEPNASRWVALEEHGVKVHCVDINPGDWRVLKEWLQRREREVRRTLKDSLG